MHTLAKLIALNQAILKIDLEWLDDIFANTSNTLDLQERVFTNANNTLDLQESIISQSKSQNTTTNNNSTQQISEKIISNIQTMERFVSSFGENINDKILMQNSLASVDKLKVSESDKLISQLSTLEQTLPELHTPTSINSSGIFTKTLEENSIRNSKTTQSSNYSTNIHIDKVEVNDVSNVNDLALQLQQKVSTL